MENLTPEDELATKNSALAESGICQSEDGACSPSSPRTELKTESDHLSGAAAPSRLLLEPFDWNKNRRPRLLKENDVVLLFDLNGTLTSHTTKRRGGRNNLRPGIEHLLKLKGRFRLGIFSSATQRTVDKVIVMFWERLGEHLFDPELIFSRDHTQPVTKRMARLHRLKPWDTVKPLSPLFDHLHRVLLFDDDPWKAVDGEKSNMVIIPSWIKEESADVILEALVQRILELMADVPEDADLRSIAQQLNKNMKPSRPEASSNVLPLPRVKQNGERERDQW